MLRIVFCLVLWFIEACNCYASVNSDADAKAFLEEIVRSDFEGDASPRIGHVVRNRWALGAEGAAAGPAFEVYDMDSDPLIVVTDWKFVAVRRKASSKVCGEFSFTVVATTIGKGLPSWMTTNARHIQALAKSRSDTVAYCATFDKGVWMLTNAPVPRVSKKRLISFMQEISARAAKIASEMGNAPNRAVTNAQRIAKSLTEQLAVLLIL